MFLIILSAAGLTAGLSEGGWRSIPQTATQCDYENQKPTWGILSRKVARPWQVVSGRSVCGARAALFHVDWPGDVGGIPGVRGRDREDGEGRGRRAGAHSRRERRGGFAVA